MQHSLTVGVLQRLVLLNPRQYGITDELVANAAQKVQFKKIVRIHLDAFRSIMRTDVSTLAY